MRAEYIACLFETLQSGRLGRIVPAKVVKARDAGNGLEQMLIGAYDYSI